MNIGNRTQNMLKDILQEAELGYIELSGGVYIMTQEDAVADQKSWDCEDPSKDFDFTTYKYWIQVIVDHLFLDTPADIFTGIDNIDDLAEYLKDQDLLTEYSI